LPQDTEHVVALSRLIWGGNDYLHLVWDQWLKESGQVLAVAEYGGRLAGCGRVGQVSPGEFWLEGLRVHPEFQGRGFAHHIQAYLLEQWKRLGGGTVRLLTASTRKPVMHMMEADGFSALSEMTSITAQPDLNGADFTPTAVDEIPRLLKEAQANRLFPPLLNLMDVGWKYAIPCPTLLLHAAAEQQLYSWRGGQGWVSFYPDESEGPKSLILGYVYCAPEDFIELAGDVRSLAGALNFDQVVWNLLDIGDLHDQASVAGYETSEDEEVLILFEKSEHGMTDQVVR
jgi:GNAT superfamily N-acetyltransferase